MLAYLFWHAPSPDVDPRQYETALLEFLSDLSGSPPAGFGSCTTFQISEVPWLNKQPRYEDWYFVRSSADLDALNEAAVKPSRWNVHAAVASKMGVGHGGLYQHLLGHEQPHDGGRAAWLTRPRGIRYQDALEKIIEESEGFLSCWRRQMVLGPADEFVVLGTSQLRISAPQGRRMQTVERTSLAPPQRL